MDDLTEEELRQIVGGGTVRTGGGYMYQPQFNYVQTGHGEEGGRYEPGELLSILKYKEGQTAPGQTYDVLDPLTGKVTGAGAFKKPGNAWDLLKESAADLGPILSFTPLAPFVRAIGALSAAEQGNILGALASGLPLADKIPGLDKATVTALQNAGKYASVASAAKSKDPMQLLNALSQTPQFSGKVPQEFKTIGDYASKASAFQRASKGDIGAILGLMTAANKSGVSPKGFAGDVDLSAADAIEGFFEPGGEGFDTSQIPDYLGSPPEETEQKAAPFGDWYQQGATPTYSGVPEWDDALDVALQAGKTPGVADQSIDVVANLPGLNEDFTLEDLRPGTGFSKPSDQRMFTVSEDKPQTIEVTGKKETPDYTQDLWPPIDPKSIRDIGNVTQIQPGEKLEGTEIKEPDLAANLPLVQGDTKATTKPSTKPATKTGTDSQFISMTGSPGQPTVYNPIMFQGRPFDLETFFKLAHQEQISPEELMKILRG